VVPRSTSLLASTRMAVPCLIAASIVFHLSADSQIFALVVKDSVVSHSARWLAPHVTFARFNTGLLLSSNSSELSPMIASI
jgi:hypothetical protein